MNSKDLKSKFINFFEGNKHKEIPSASLIPENDPTVLFTTAGMHPLVPFLMGQPHPLGKRLVDVQKCVRTGDIDEVGDTTHHTFFEMLGNWSLGDYFKKETLEWSFEFLTKELNIPLSHLAVTVFEGEEGIPKDEEAAKIWEDLGILPGRVAFLNREENWWGPAGLTGPCGPDSEMSYWVGSEEPPKVYDPEDDRWVEIWNDVFMQYNKNKDGSYTELEQKNVDTGMGVERVTALLQGFDDNYRTELFWPLIEEVERLSGKQYHNEYVKSMRIIADHVKASVFMIGDARGISPSNVDQGYVLRRLIRRAIRHARLLGIEGSFCSELALIVVEMYPEYKELEANKDKIVDELNREEEKFSKSLANGIKHFEKLTDGDYKNFLSGKDAFLLFQSYGFPIEMTVELGHEKGVEVDERSFFEEFEKHQALSRKGAEQKFKGGLQDNSEATTRLHTATHLLNEALRKVVDSEIKQKGSNITAERLRFDFSFDRKLTPEEVEGVEKWINDAIEAGVDVSREEVSKEDAMSSGAQSEFGAKYPDVVSVYTMGEFSKEICMGPHVKNTKELGHFKIKKQESVAAGVRRIKAILN